MPKNRKLFSPETIDESLIDEIVLFKMKDLPTGDDKSIEVILIVKHLYPNTNRIEGHFIAGDIEESYYDSAPDTDPFGNTDRLKYNIWLTSITGYRILTKKDLPLLLGYEYTTDLLAELIKLS